MAAVTGLANIETDVAYFESRGQNILNCCASAQCSSSPNCAPMRAGIPQTAGGFFQMTNTLWNAEAPKAGVNTAEYPTAISAPASVQTAVFAQTYSDRGLQDWTGNAPLMAAVQGGTVQSASGFDPTLAAAISGNAQTQPAQTSTATGYTLPNPLGAGAGDNFPVSTVGVNATGTGTQPVNGATVQTPTQLAASVESWLSSAAVEVGLAILAIGFIAFAVAGGAKSIITVPR